MSPLNFYSLRSACQAVLVSSLGCGVFAAPIAVEPIREAEKRQGEIGGQAQGLVEALDGMLGEFERNNLGGEDAAVVRALRGRLSRLNVEEMRRVVDLLQQARSAKGQGAAAQSVADAFAVQKGISVELARIVAGHSRAGEAAELAAKLGELADRQAGNLRNGIQVARLGKSQPGAGMDAVRAAQLETQRGEQSAIGAEVQIATGRLKKLLAEPMDDAAAREMGAAAGLLAKVEADALLAAEKLKLGMLEEALAYEMSGRDALRKVARAVSPRERGAEALRKAEGELGKLMAEQEELRNSTLRHDLTVKPEQERSQSQAVLGRNEDVQGELAVKNDFLGQDLTELPVAREALKDVNKQMQEAQSALKSMDAKAAAVKQAEALGKMAVAREEIRKRAEEAEMLAAAGGDKSKNLEMLKNAVENLAKEEAGLAKSAQPGRAEQADVARRAAKMAERTANLAPKAVESMKAAVQKALESEAAMGMQDFEKGRAEAAKAAENLAMAAQEIAKELAKTAAAQEQAEAIGELAAELGKLIEAEQSVDLAAAKAGKGDLAELAKKQAGIQEMTEKFKEGLGAGQLASMQALGDAMADMGAARAELEAGNATPAREAAQRAIEKLMAAKGAMGNQLADAAKQAGMQAMTPEEMAKAANKIQQAMQEVNAAQESLSKAAAAVSPAAQQAMQQAAQQLSQASQQAGQAAAQGMTPEMAQAAQEAAKNLANAAAQAMAGQNPAAQAMTQEAAKQLAQAAAMMAAQQAGISGQMAGKANQPGEGKEPGPGMKGQGQKPGRGSGTGKKQVSTNEAPSEGAEDYKAGGDPQAVERGARQAALKKANFIGLPPREREAIQQSITEKYPSEYGAMVEQYLLNLANEAAKK